MKHKLFLLLSILALIGAVYLLFGCSSIRRIEYENQYSFQRKIIIFYKKSTPTLGASFFREGDTLFIGQTCAWHDTMYMKSGFIENKTGEKFYKKKQ